MTTCFLGGVEYFLTLIDGFPCFWIYAIQCKVEVLEELKEFKYLGENQSKEKIVYQDLWTVEYATKTLELFLIFHSLS